MTAETCDNEDQYMGKAGSCCKRCGAGYYIKAECDGAKDTECVRCEHGHYTATKNHMEKCNVCRNCIPESNQKVAKPCTAEEDAVCTCVPGFYCSNDKCEHCQPVSSCPPGEGVKVAASHTNNTVCAPCEEGTFSNVMDFQSPCLPHTRCKDIGREPGSPGTSTSDAKCGVPISNCHWMLPAGLWSGLVLTALILFIVVWWLKRKSCRSASCPIVPVTVVDVIPMPESLLPSEPNGCSPLTCAVDGCPLPVYTPGHDALNGDAAEPLKPSVSFTECSHGNGSTGYCTGFFGRSISEPQEDEWCGT